MYKCQIDKANGHNNRFHVHTFISHTFVFYAITKEFQYNRDGRAEVARALSHV